MKTILVLSVLCFAFAANALTHREHFEKFVSDFNRKYESPEEKEARFAIFQDNLVRIKQLNANSKHATFAANEFADMTAEEFRSKMLMPKQSAQVVAESCLAKGVGVQLKYSKEELSALPDSFDWRTTGGKDGKGTHLLYTCTHFCRCCYSCQEPSKFLGFGFFLFSFLNFQPIFLL